ncbi:hypothetical protein ACLOJK_005979 [Asimina triloba]
MEALTDATAHRVSRPREDAARGEWRDGEERGRPTLAFAPAPETFKLIASSSHPRHHLLRSSSASVPVVYSVSRRLSLFPIVLSVSLAPPIIFTGPAPCPASSLFIIRLRSSPVIAIPCPPRCLSRSTHRLHRSRSLPSVFPVHHPPSVLAGHRRPLSSSLSLSLHPSASPVPLPSQDLGVRMLLLSKATAGQFQHGWTKLIGSSKRDGSMEEK